MLKGIPPVLSPELLKVLCEMGHSDTIVIGDGNFPACSVGKNSIVIRADGHTANELLDAILTLFPLDTVPQPAAIMDVLEGMPEPAIWREFEATLDRRCGLKPDAIRRIERFAFYEEAKKAYAVISTVETAAYGNIILSKGVVTF